jgi:thiosulfate/3-mercaptopyruvate sulfurtransferase
VYKTEGRKDRRNTLNDVQYLTSVTELLSSLDDPDLRIVDCRFELLDPGAGRLNYHKAHIPGAVYVDLDKDLAGPIGPNTGRHPLPDVASATKTFGRLGIDADIRVVVYDDASGALAAARAWWILRWLGHDKVSLLDGGLAEWMAQGQPLEMAEVDVEPRKFIAAPRDNLVLGTEEIVEAARSAGDLRLIDARDRVRFVGEEEPIDKVAGHIAGARNLPFSTSLGEDGLWKSPEQLAEGLASVLGDPSAAPWSVMCGSGVTACHLVIAGLIAGYREPRLYVGSWSEWIADPARQVVKGPA